MRIVSYEEMKKMPVGTVFFECTGGFFGQLDGPMVKDAESDNDIYYCKAVPTINYAGSHPRSENPIERGDHISLDSDGTREGSFDHDAQYLVLDPADVQAMIDILQGKGARAEPISAEGVKAWMSA
jgi:hypothetical protein